MQKHIVNLKDQKTGTKQGCAGTSNPGVNRKPDTPLKGIHNLIPNITQNQWPHILAIRN